MKENVKNYLSPGHNACPGCGVAIAVRLILRAAGQNVIVCSPTGCLETFTSPYGASAWEVPWMHPLFENAPAVASGIEAALKYKGDTKTRVIVIGGDGATFDIGLSALSGMLERGHEVLYICYDNEAYSNTGIQRSGATPYGASTITTPVGELSFGKKDMKKDMLAIALAHHVKHVSSSTIAYPQDLMKKVKKALSSGGPAYMHVLIPCNLGWGINPEETVEISRLAVETGMFPMVEYIDGELVQVFKPGKIKPVMEYLQKQKRFKHLFESKNAAVLKRIQEIADKNIRRYSLLRSSA